MTANSSSIPDHSPSDPNEFEILVSKINIPAFVLNNEGRVLFSNPHGIREKNIKAGDRVILQDDPVSKKKYLLRPTDATDPSAGSEVFSLSESSWKGEPAQFVLLEDDRSAKLAELNESQRMMQTLVSNLPGMAYRCKLDSAWTMTYVSNRCFELTGYSQDDLTNNRFNSYGDLILAEDRQKVWDNIRSAVEENRPYQLTYRIQPKTGPCKWVWEQGRTVYTQEGKRAAIEGLIIDVTDRQVAAEALAESEERYRSLIQASPDGVVFIDLHGKIMLCNHKLCDLVGESDQKKLIGKPVFKVLNLGSRRDSAAKIIKALRENAPVSESATLVMVNGKRVPIELHIAMVHNASGVTSGYLIVVRNMTQQDDDQRALRESEAIYRVIVEDSPQLILRFKPNGVISFANKAFCQYHQIERQALIGKNLANVLPQSSIDLAPKLMKDLSPSMEPKILEYPVKTPGDQMHWLSWVTRPIVDNQNRFIEYQAVGEDITSHKNAEQTLSESEFRFRELLGNVKLIAIILDLQGTMTFCNNFFCDLVGMSKEEIIGKNWLESFMAIDDSIAFRKLLLECGLTGTIPAKRENLVLTKQGEQRLIAWTNTTLSDKHGNVTGIASIGQDITERNFTEKIQAAIYKISQSANQAEDLDQLYFLIHQVLQELMPADNFFIALMDNEQDLLSFPYFVDQLDTPPPPQKPGRGLTEYVLRTGKTVLVNPEVFNLLVEENEVESVGSPSVDWLGVPLKVENRIIGVMGAQSYSEGIRFKYRDEQMMAFVSTQVAMAIDRKRSEQELRKSQKRNELLVEASTDAIFVETLDGKILDCNSVASKMYGYSHEALCRMTVRDLVPETRIPLMPDYTDGGVEIPGMISETENVRADGSVFPIEISTRLTTIEGDQVVVAYVRDITERKQTENAIIESEAKFRDLAETTAAGIFIHRGDKYLYVNPAWCQMTGFDVDELKNIRIYDRISEEQGLELRERFLVHLRGAQEVDQYELRFETKSGEKRWFDIHSGLINYEGRTAIIGTAVDVTERKQHAHEMEAIVQMSEILRSKTKLGEIPSTILEKLPDLLNIDGALLCTFEKTDKDLIHFYGAGSWNALSGITLQKDQGLAGFIMNSGKPYINHAASTDPHFAFPEMIQTMTSLVGAPMIAQEKITGALIVGSVHYMEEFEIHLLMAITDIAANALHRSFLYEQTLDQTEELKNAYNATLEGWAHALELRDKETQGHSLRIANLTLRLARRMGYDENLIENLRQGALLHDIGKMGIPDTILLKHGTLTETEWTVMRKHPIYARDMLSQIPFFKGSIDVPYSHHEWWDGSGYPQGLSGEQIPRAARIFAIVDAWDALISNRPYRKAWDRKEALAHIINQAGTHFDPDVVDAFVKLLREEGETSD